MIFPSVLFAFLTCARAQTPALQFEPDRVQQLLNIRRIYVEKLTGASSEQIRDLLLSSLQTAKLFIVTENQERADAILRGTAEDLIYQDQFQFSEGINTRVSGGTSSGSGRTRQGAQLSAGAGEHESQRTVERRHEAIASLRLVNRDGDLIWSTTQESRGAKFRGAAADVAEKVARQLALDYERAKKAGKPAAAPATPK